MNSISLKAIPTYLTHDPYEPPYKLLKPNELSKPLPVQENNEKETYTTSQELFDILESIQ